MALLFLWVVTGNFFNGELMMAEDVTTTTEANGGVVEAALPRTVLAPEVVTPVVTVETTTPTAPTGVVMGPSVSIDREYLAQVIRKQCGHAPDMATMFANGLPPEEAIPLEQAARSGDLATVHTLLAEITPK